MNLNFQDQKLRRKNLSQFKHLFLNLQLAKFHITASVLHGSVRIVIVGKTNVKQSVKKMCCIFSPLLE